MADDPLDNTVPVTPEVRAFWEAFCAASGVDPATPFQAWFFGDGEPMASELLALVLSGQKRATACLELTCLRVPAGAPVPGGYSVVTDAAGRPGAVIRTTELRWLPFDEVDAAFAWDEGEGDRTLEDWRRGHLAFFSRECAELGVEMRGDLRVGCERFERLWPR